MSALDAAATVLKDATKPMRSKELIDAMTEQKLWTSPNGKTPHATLYAAMNREIAAKGDESRFQKTGPGHFAFQGEKATPTEQSTCEEPTTTEDAVEVAPGIKKIGPGEVMVNEPIVRG